jgi:F-type H+-transporting ATPase subunit b
MKRFVAGILFVLVPVLARAQEAAGNVLEINWGLWIWTALTFLVLFALLAKLAFKPIAVALDRRNQTIKTQLDEAERSRAEAKKLMEDYQRQLAEARTEANKIIEEARSLGENVRKEVVEKANTESAALVQRAQEEIERQKEKGVQELKDTVAQLSVQIASRVLEKEVNEATHRQLVENLIKDLGKMRKA